MPRVLQLTITSLPLSNAFLVRQKIQFLYLSGLWGGLCDPLQASMIFISEKTEIFTSLKLPQAVHPEANLQNLPEHAAAFVLLAELFESQRRLRHRRFWLGRDRPGRRFSAMAFPQNFQTFVFLDLETTGLPQDQPRVSELSLFAVHCHSLQCSPGQIPQLPRVMDKLTLCIDPKKPFTSGAEKITGLNNRNLEENCKPDFSVAVGEILKTFLDRQARPVCLVAHNGLGFDFPLLCTELRQVEADLPPDTGCLDTLLAFKELDKAANRSYRLGELYRYYYGQEPPRAHSAEGDVLSLLLVFLAKAPELMLWAALNARSWKEIKPMYCVAPPIQN